MLAFKFTQALYYINDFTPVLDSELYHSKCKTFKNVNMEISNSKPSS